MTREPIDPELGALFRKEPMPEPSEGTRARVLARLEGSLATIAAPPSHAHAASLAHSGAVTSKVLVVWSAAALVVGGVVGGSVVVALRPAPPKVVYVDRVIPAPSTSAPALLPPPQLDPPIGSTSPIPRPAPATSGASEGLTAERLLIDAARTRLTSGDPAAALARLQEHARRFPSGRLEEEREALTVEALVQSGRYEAARARAERMHARWPESVFLSAVDATIQSIPQ
jgi:hypothetical protein